MRPALIAQPPVEDRPRSKSALSLSAAAVAAFAYIGFDAAYPRGDSIFGFSVALIVAIVIAALALRDPIRSPAMRGYFKWAAALSICMVVSAVSAWDSTAVYGAVTVAVWLLFIIPGLAKALRFPKMLEALLVGLAAGSAIYLVAATLRVLHGSSVLDVVTGQTVSTLLGVNRNALDAKVLLLVPFLVAGVGAFRLHVIRWPLLVMSGLWIVYSAGRAGLIGLVIALFVYALMQPSLATRLRLVLALVVVTAAAYGWIQSSGGQAAESSQRIVAVLHGTRDQADEARGLLLRKAWYLASRNPVVGVGFGRFASSYSPVVEEASVARVRDLVVELNTHNTYAEMLAEVGFPGLLTFAGLLAYLLAMGFKNARDRRSRVVTSALCGLMFVAFFHTMLSVLFYFPMAALLSADPAVRADSGRPVADARSASHAAPA